MAIHVLDGTTHAAKEGRGFLTSLPREEDTTRSRRIISVSGTAVTAISHCSLSNTDKSAVRWPDGRYEANQFNRVACVDGQKRTRREIAERWLRARGGSWLVLPLVFLLTP